MSATENKAVFLSYASQDAEAAQRVAEALRAAGVEVWFDKDELVGGDAWDAKIRGQIASCALFVPVISAATQARLEGYFRLEWKLAAQRTHTMADEKTFLLPVVIDTTRDAEAKVPVEFKTVQWTKLSGGETPEKFCVRVKTLLGGETDQGGSGVGARLVHARGDGRGPAAPRQKPARSWVAPAVAVGALVVALAIWQPWKKSAPKAANIAVPSPLAATTPVAPLSEARQLVAKVWDLLNKPGRARAELDTADLLCKRASTLDPSDAEVWAAWAQTDVAFLYNVFDASAARREAAREHAARAMQLDPHSYEARLAQAAYLAHGWPAIESRTVSPEAEPLIRELLRERPGDPRAALELFILVWTDEAFSLLESVAKNHPAFAARALNELAWRLFFTKRFGEADAMADRSIAVHPDYNNLGLKITLALYWHGDLELAKATLRRMPTSALQEDWGAFLGCRVYAWRQEFADGLAALSAIPREWLSAGVFSGPKALLTAELHRRAGQAELARRDYQRALAQLDARLAAEPNDTALLAKKAEALFYLHRRPEADACYHLLRETGVPPPLNLQILFEPPEVALAALEEGALYINNNQASFSAAALRLTPFYAPLRSHPRFAALLAQAEADPKRSPNAKSPKSAGPTTATAVDDKSVAVLAFANLSDEKASEYFSDGISEELLNVLAKVPGLKVSARTSAFYFKGKNLPIPEIAAKLNVAYVVEGSVQRAGERVKITAQLIKAADGFHLWSDTFTRDAKDVFAVQEEIAGLIAKQLSLKLGASSAAATAAINPQAFEFYVQAREAWKLRTLADYDRAEDLLNRALALEPNFARAHVALADVWFLRAQDTNLIGSFGQRGSPEFARIKDRINHALALDPELAEAHASLGGVAWVGWDAPTAERELRRAIALNPNYATAHQWLGRTLNHQGRLEEGLAELKLATELDPLASRILDNYSFGLSHAGRYAEAIAYIDRALALQPNAVQARIFKVGYLLSAGRVAEAVDLARTLPIDQDTGCRAAQGVALARAGRKAEAAALLAGFSTTDEGVKIVLLLALGRMEEAIALVKPENMFAYHLDIFLFDPNFDPIRRDPRFVRLLADLGATEAHARAQAWRAAHPLPKTE